MNSQELEAKLAKIFPGQRIQVTWSIDSGYTRRKWMLNIRNPRAARLRMRVLWAKADTREECIKSIRDKVREMNADEEDVTGNGVLSPKQFEFLSYICRWEAAGYKGRIEHDEDRNGQCFVGIRLRSPTDKCKEGKHARSLIDAAVKAATALRCMPTIKITSQELATFAKNNASRFAHLTAEPHRSRE